MALSGYLREPLPDGKASPKKHYFHCSVCGKHTEVITIEKIGGIVHFCYDCWMKSTFMEAP